ncbi:hypothetical protein [Winogradskyella pacifica]|uniref:hypothetical protein n=1 Tax=Winogradskyella pacifica TaxID=664642 RepID=UPI0015CA8BB1|nr:hypothetical protein [Winogradskyella pacifica]
MRNILATIIGFIAASVTVYIFESLIGQSLFPLPEGANAMDLEWLSSNMDKIPMGAKIFVVIAHFLGIVTGMFVAALISKKSRIPSYIVGALMLAATFFNIVMLPKELWFTLSDGLFAIIGFYLGHVVASKTINTSKAIHNT